MDPSNIPKHILRIIQDKFLPMDQKMVAFMMHMPTLPDDPKNDQLWEDNLEVGGKIKKLIDTGKIHIGKSDKDFKLDIRII